MPQLADPLPERRLARMLAAWLAGGLVFLVLPGTFLGVWNLIGISASRTGESIPASWIQAHGHAQFFGWVGSFMIGIALYTFPKFRGRKLRSLAAAWIMWALWTGAVAARWASGVLAWQWESIGPATAAAELAVALLLIWQCAGPGRHTGMWNRLVFTGFAGLCATLVWQVAALLPPPATPAIPEQADRALLFLAVWTFAFPVAWGFSARLLPAFLGLAKPAQRAADFGLVFLAAAVFCDLASLPGAGLLVLAATLAACWSLRIFHRPAGRPKTLGVDRLYPVFARIAFGWLVISAALACAGTARGWVGASRHAFTVGFLATLIFAIGPRILPSFVNSRELWSPRLMRAALLLITTGCALRVAAEPPAYSGAWPFAWSVLPVSAVIELLAVVAFAANIGVTLAMPFPAWIEPQSITADLPVYWYVNSYPRTRAVLERAGLQSIRGGVSPSLTLREAAAKDRVDPERLLEALRDYFDRRLARTLREKRGA